MSGASPEVVVLDGGIGFGRLPLAAGQGLSEALELRIQSTEAGVLHARPTRPDEQIQETIGVSELRLIVGRPRSAVGVGDVVVWVAEQDGQAIVGQNVALGAGCITLTDQRVLGVVFASSVDAAKLRVSVDEDGAGEIIAFSVDRPHVQDLKTKKAPGGQVRSATFSGACELEFDPDKLLNAHGVLTSPARGEMLDVLKRYVAGEPPREPAAPAQDPPPEAPATGARVYCGDCGAAIRPDAKFCGSCGASQEDAAFVSRSEAQTLFTKAPKLPPKTAEHQPEPSPPPPPQAHPAAQRLEQLNPGAGELAGQLAGQVSTPGFMVAGISALFAFAAMAALGLVAAIVSPDRSLIGSVGRDSGIFEEALRLIVGTTLGRIDVQGAEGVGEESLKVVPAFFALAPLGGAFAGAMLQAHRTQGKRALERIAWGAAAGLPLALMSVVLSLVAGGDVYGQSVDFNAGSVLFYAALWGAIGGGAGVAFSIRRADPEALRGLVPTAVQPWLRLVTVPTRSLAVALAASALIGLAAWEVQTLKGEPDAKGERSTLTGTVENVLYASDFGVQALALGTFAEGRASAPPLGYPLPLGDDVDPEDVPKFFDGYRVTDYRHAYPFYAFLPLFVILVGIPLLLMLYAGFATARAMSAPSVGLAAAYGAAVGAVWSIGLVIVRAIVDAGAIDGDSLFVMNLLLGCGIGAAGGALSATTRAAQR